MIYMNSFSKSFSSCDIFAPLWLYIPNWMHIAIESSMDDRIIFIHYLLWLLDRFFLIVVGHWILKIIQSQNLSNEHLYLWLMYFHYHVWVEHYCIYIYFFEYHCKCCSIELILDNLENNCNWLSPHIIYLPCCDNHTWMLIFYDLIHMKAHSHLLIIMYSYTHCCMCFHWMVVYIIIEW